jgi:hypothetical protein
MTTLPGRLVWAREVELYLAESFTFRMLEPAAAVLETTRDRE